MNVNRMRRTRWLMRMVSAALAVAVLIGGLGIAELGTSAAKSRATSRAKKRFENRAVSLAIVDGGIASSSTIQVSGLDAPVTDVNVSLFAIDFRGDGTQDLDVLLVGPGGSALILSDVGGFTTTSNITVTLDDQQQEPLPSNTALTFGFFQPTNFGSPDTMNLGNGPVTVESGDSLGVFNGVNPNGEWRLFVFDDSPGNDVPVPGSGIIGGWALEITTDNGVPRSAADTFQAQAGKTLNVPAPGVLANDSDPDGDVLTAQLINEPRKGTVLLRPDGSFTYRAKKKARGTDFFGYLVRDPSGLTGLEGVSIQIKGKGKKKKGRR
jgi:hypothetical protein